MLEYSKDKQKFSNTVIDHNKIERIVFIGYALASIKLALSIFNISFFTGIFWYIFVDITDDLQFEETFFTSFEVIKK